MQIAVHLWATGEGTLSSLSFLIIRDLSSMLGSNGFDSCWIKMYKAFIANSKFAEPILHKHMQFLRDSFVELCSLDVHRTTTRAKASIQQLTKILHQGLRTKKKVSCQGALSCFLESRTFNVLLFVQAYWKPIFIYNTFSMAVLLFAGSCQDDVQLAIYQLH